MTRRKPALRLTRRGERLLYGATALVTLAAGVLTAPGAPLSFCWGGVC
ncbi:MAG: hypothetical protein JWO67_31 [Streptosporangiaceae bacterium]|nr:hypothetical protein [Streptosporangiaceae bacterium]